MIFNKIKKVIHKIQKIRMILKIKKKMKKKTVQVKVKITQFNKIKLLKS